MPEALSYTNRFSVTSILISTWCLGLERSLWLSKVLGPLHLPWLSGFLLHQMWPPECICTNHHVTKVWQGLRALLCNKCFCNWLSFCEGEQKPWVSPRRFTQLPMAKAGGCTWILKFELALHYSFKKDEQMNNHTDTIIYKAMSIDSYGHHPPWLVARSCNLPLMPGPVPAQGM